jgi:hypothetical protein
MAHSVLRHGFSESASSISDSLLDTGHFSFGLTIALLIGMNLWGTSAAGSERHRVNLRHEFVIGPLRESDLFSSKGRLYYCTHCRWSFLVCGDKVAVLDEDGSLLAGPRSTSRFATFEEGPCPVLEAFESVALAAVYKSRASVRSESDGCREPASSNFPIKPERPRPLLRVLDGMRENLSRRARSI